MFIVYSKRHNGYLSKKWRGRYWWCSYDTDEWDKWYNKEINRARKFIRKYDALNWAYTSFWDEVIEIEAKYEIKNK